MRRIIVWFLCVVSIAGVLAYVARRPLLHAVGGFLVAADEPQTADAIVVLSGSLPDRIMEAVDLYHAHLAPRLVLTREYELPGLAALRARGVTLPEQHEQNMAIAEQLGVPAAAITVMPKPTASTVTEVRALLTYLDAQGIRSILLVTSKTHARRARLIFRGLAGDRMRVRVCPSRYDPFDADDWWHHRAWVRRVVIEYGKLLTYLCVDRWRGAPSGAET